MPNALQITYVAGYAAEDSPDDETALQAVIPAAVRVWMESKIAAHDVFREQVIAGVQAFKIPRDFTDGLLDPLILGERLF